MEKKSGKRVETLCSELLQSPLENVNHVPLLIKTIRRCKNKNVHKLVIETLGEFFSSAIERGDLVIGEKNTTEERSAAEQRYLEWLKKQYANFKAEALSILGSSQPAALQVSALSVLMEAVGTECVGVFNNELYEDVCKKLVTSAETPSKVLSAWMAKYFPFADVRYYTLRSVERLAQLHKERQEGTPMLTECTGPERGFESLSTALYDVLVQCPANVSGCLDEKGGLRSWCGASEVGVAIASGRSADRKKRRKLMKRLVAEGRKPDNSGKKPSCWADPKAQQKMFSSAWIAFLQLDLPEDLIHRVLLQLPDEVIPNMPNPQLLCDFLTRGVNLGGIVGVLALNGLFILVTQHGLEYPEFYKRLYGLIDPTVFHLKQRVRFLSLVGAFLGSGLVPAYSAAAFIKRFARIALVAPPFGAMACITFIHNLVRKHPSCDVLLHKPVKLEDQGGGGDVYNASEEDPALSRAIESSLWEIEALRNHSCPMVATYSTMLDKDLTDRRKTAIADSTGAISASYTSLFEEGVKKRVKSVAVVFYKTPPKRLFEEEWWNFSAEQGVDAGMVE